MSPRPSTRPSPRRTQAMRSEETRSRLIAAMIKVIHSRGLPAATLEAIAAEAGLSKSAAMHHFADKAALLRAACSQIISSNLAAYAAVREDPAVDSDTVVTRLLSTIWATYRSHCAITEIEAWMATRSSLDTDADLHAALRDECASFHARGRDMLHAVVSDIQGASAEEFAVMFETGLAVMRGLSLEHHLGTSDAVADAAEFMTWFGGSGHMLRAVRAWRADRAGPDLADQMDSL